MFGRKGKRWVKGNAGYIHTDKICHPKELETLNCIIKDLSYLKPTRKELEAIIICSKRINEQTPMDKVILMYDSIVDELNKREDDVNVTDDLCSSYF